VKSATHLHLLPGLRMTGVIPVLPLYVLVVWTRKILCSNCMGFYVLKGNLFNDAFQCETFFFGVVE
jgi:hypothetical protein